MVIYPSFFKISRIPVAWLNVRKPTYSQHEMLTLLVWTQLYIYIFWRSEDVVRSETVKASSYYRKFWRKVINNFSRIGHQGDFKTLCYPLVSYSTISNHGAQANRCEEWMKLNTGEPRFKTDRQPFRYLIIVTIGLLLNKFNFALFQV